VTNFRINLLEGKLSPNKLPDKVLSESLSLLVINIRKNLYTWWS